MFNVKIECKNNESEAHSAEVSLSLCLRAFVVKTAEGG